MTEHVPSERVQASEEKVPDPELDQPTVPDGELPVTVAVHSLGAPTATESGLQLTAVLVPDRPVIVTEP